MPSPYDKPAEQRIRLATAASLLNWGFRIVGIEPAIAHAHWCILVDELPRRSPSPELPRPPERPAQDKGRIDREFEILEDQ